MKINEKDEKYISYGEIHVGECFKYNTGIYIKSKNGGVTEDVNLENGLISPPLLPNAQVIYLPNATVNTNRGE